MERRSSEGKCLITELCCRFVRDGSNQINTSYNYVQSETPISYDPVVIAEQESNPSIAWDEYWDLFQILRRVLMLAIAIATFKERLSKDPRQLCPLRLFSKKPEHLLDCLSCLDVIDDFHGVLLLGLAASLMGGD